MTLTITLWHILAFALAMAGGAGTLGALVATGVAQRLLVPLIRAEILAHDASATTVEAREKATARVIDDHLRRDDGLIYQRFVTQGERLEMCFFYYIYRLFKMRGKGLQLSNFTERS